MKLKLPLPQEKMPTTKHSANTKKKLVSTRKNSRLNSKKQPDLVSRIHPSQPKTKMELQIKLGTLNLCQGLQSKKNLVKQTIIHEEIDLLFMQETEIKFNLNHELLSFPGYTIINYTYKKYDLISAARPIGHTAT